MKSPKEQSVEEDLLSEQEILSLARAEQIMKNSGHDFGTIFKEIAREIIKD